jgi:hypothetical protein
MNAILAKEVNKIIEEGRKRDYRLDARPCVGAEGYVFGHADSGKAIVLCAKDGDNIIKAYSININKWIWAEQEGFSTEMMVTELKHEIFSEIPLESSIEYLV